MSRTNSELSELLARAAEEAEGHRVRALHRASRAAMLWTEEAASVAASGHELTTLASVGPWITHFLAEWLEHSHEVPEPPELRRGFLTRRRCARRRLRILNFLPVGKLRARVPEVRERLRRG